MELPESAPATFASTIAARHRLDGAQGECRKRPRSPSGALRAALGRLWPASPRRAPASASMRS
jgi:hypothetical protein